MKILPLPESKWRNIKVANCHNIKSTMTLPKLFSPVECRRCCNIGIFINALLGLKNIMLKRLHCLVFFLWVVTHTDAKGLHFQWFVNLPICLSYLASLRLLFVYSSDYSDAVSFFTNGSAPSQPDPPMLGERKVEDLTISWVRRQNDDEFVLQMDDESMVCVIGYWICMAKYAQVLK